jgi:hypothetical protein
LISIEVNPYTAFVTVPELVARVGGRAKNARYAREWPSSRKRRRGVSGDVGGVTGRIVAAARDGAPAIRRSFGPERA